MTNETQTEIPATRSKSKGFPSIWDGTAAQLDPFYDAIFLLGHILRGRVEMVAGQA
jgi:hypothetical protein